jgi:hypothetical protein
MTTVLLLSLMIVMMMMMTMIAASARGTMGQSRSGDRQCHDGHPPTDRLRDGFAE